MTARLDIPFLQKMVYRYYQLGISSATRATYSCGEQCYLTFCSAIHQEPLPTSESTLDNLSSPTMVQVRIKQSKQPFHQGVTIYVGKTDTTICPVTALLPYLSL